MQRLITLIGLQCYAVVLAIVQYGNGVRTDEAKYLMNIPYPHPPLVRWMLSRLDWFRGDSQLIGSLKLHIDQEFIVRFLFATLMVHAAWFVWSMGRNLPKTGRVALCMLWLGTTAFVVQTGTVMMAPLTALQALLFLWILSLPKERLPGAATIGFLWLLTLFTALQGMLLAPLAIAALRAKGTPLKGRLWYIGAPLVVLGLYIITNPLIPASFTLITNKDAALPLLGRLGSVVWILIVAGSGVGTVAGIIGLLFKRHWFILAAFILVLLYSVVGGHDYYAILFLPFFVTGWKHLFRRYPKATAPIAIGSIVCTVILLACCVPFVTERGPAKAVMAVMGRYFEPAAPVFVYGPMGHEWQYEAYPLQNIEPFNEALVSNALGGVVICTASCPDMWQREGWAAVGGLPLEAFIRTD